MYNVPEQLLVTNKDNLETFVEFAGIAAAGAEKLLDLQMKIAKAVFADTVKHAKTVVAAKDVQGLWLNAPQPTTDLSALSWAQ